MPLRPEPSSKKAFRKIDNSSLDDLFSQVDKKGRSYRTKTGQGIFASIFPVHLPFPVISPFQNAKPFCRLYYIALFVLMVAGLLPPFAGTAQPHQAVATAPPANRLPIVWKYSSLQFISDKPPQQAQAWLEDLSRLADSLHDAQLKAYARYFNTCSLILFSEDYEKHFAPGDYLTVVNTFTQASEQALQSGHPDIAASAEHYVGQIYFRVGLYGQAFEHLLKADNKMQTMGYNNVPAISIYLYELGLNYYRFEDYDKALNCFLEAIQHPVYLPRVELNTLNAIGLIYAKRNDYGLAISFYQKTIARAQVYQDTDWIKIASGNIGSVYLAQGDNRTALHYYHMNYRADTNEPSAINDAALSALYMAKAFVRLHQPDSATTYLQHALASYQPDNMIQAEHLHFFKTYYEAAIELNRSTGKYTAALTYADSLMALKDTIRQAIDSKILSRAVQKTEAERNLAELQLLESRQKVSKLRLLLIIGALGMAIIIILLVFRNYKARKTEQDRLAKKVRKLLEVEKLRAEESLKHAGEQLATYLATLRERNDYIQLLDAEMQTLKENGTSANPQSNVMESLISSTLLTDEDWRRFRGLFEQVYPGFTSRLSDKFSNLSPAETRLLILSRLDLSSREMANMLGISVDAIRKSRYRLRKKINLGEEVDFSAFIREV